MEEEIKNRGVLIAPPTSNDYIAGEVSAIPVNEIMPSDHRSFRPEEEDQSGRGGDKMDCVTVSSAGCLETDLNFFLKNNLLPKETLDWANNWKFIKDGKFQISTAFAAIQNGTSRSGNYLNTVAQWWHENGFIPEWMLPNDQTLTWDQFYNKNRITDTMRQCAKESLEHFGIFYEWVFNNNLIEQKMKQGSIQLATACCPGWNNGDKTPVPACGLSVCHATELLEYKERAIFDSYDPHNKFLAQDYDLAYKMLYIVTPLKNNNKNNAMIIKCQGQPALYVAAGDTLIPFATDFPTYQADFATAQILDLPVGEFNKFKIASAVVITKK